MTADTTQTASDDDTPAACTICKGTGIAPPPPPCPCHARALLVALCADVCIECCGTGKASCTICGEAVDTADRWTCCAPVLADGRWVCHGCDGQPSIPSVAVVTS